MKPSTDQDGCGEAKHRDNERKREQKREPFYLRHRLCVASRSQRQRVSSE